MLWLGIHRRSAEGLRQVSYPPRAPSVPIFRPIVCFGIVCTLALCSSPSRADLIIPNIVTGDISTGALNPSAQAAGGTNFLFAHSLQFAPIPAGPNQEGKDVVTFLAAPPAPPGTFGTTISPATFQRGIPINVPPGPVPTSVAYSPVVGIQDVPKVKAPNVKESVTSRSGDLGVPPAPPGPIVQGTASYDAVGRLISARAFTTAQPKDRRVVTGRGAAAALDPFEVDSSVANYQPTIDASLQLAGPGATGGLVFFALDSRFTDPSTFYERGEPFDQALWWFAVSANDMLTSTGNLTVGFYINPAALTDDVLFLDTNGDGTNDLKASSLAGRVLGSFVVEDGQASLTSFAVFPAGTQYNVDRVITYGDGVNAGLAMTVPEPSTLMLLSVAAVASSLICCRRSVRKA